MYVEIDDQNQTVDPSHWNETWNLFSDLLPATYYTKYTIFAVCSALLGIPSNMLLLVILMRIGLYTRRQSALTLMPKKTTGSFERFLFEIVFIETLLIIYDFVDNVLSYIHEDRTAGRHYLIHISDFCCKFFTYIAKTTVPLTTWLLLFLVINQLILTVDSQNNYRSFWNRSLHYVNAKYSTVFLVFIFSVVNIYPIEVLKYLKKTDVQDYYQSGVASVCTMGSDYKNPRLLIATNYGYNLFGITIPCVIILILSIIIIFRTCRNNRFMNKEGIALHYIAGSIGIIHALFNLPGRFSDILVMFLVSYHSSYKHLIRFNHEVNSYTSLSYGYKCFVCICLSRRFRLHAKSVLCFLIENKYEDRYTIDSTTSMSNGWQQLSERRKQKRYRRQYRNGYYFQSFSFLKPTSTNFSSLLIPMVDFERYISSETTYWIRPFFTQNEQRHFLRPCGRSSSCHQISTQSLASTISSPETEIFSSRMITVDLPNGEHVHLPLPQKHVLKSQTSSSQHDSNSVETDEK